MLPTIPVSSHTLVQDRSDALRSPWAPPPHPRGDASSFWRLWIGHHIPLFLAILLPSIFCHTLALPSHIRPYSDFHHSFIADIALRLFLCYDIFADCS